MPIPKNSKINYQNLIDYAQEKKIKNMLERVEHGFLATKQQNSYQV